MDIVKWNQINIKRCSRRKGWTAIGYIFSSFCVVCISFEHTVFAPSNEKGCQTIHNIILSILKSITQKKLICYSIFIQILEHDFGSWLFTFNVTLHLNDDLYLYWL